VRGYEYYGDIGPSGGGHHKFVGNLELKFPLIIENNQTIIQGALFYDVGGAWANGHDITLSSGFGEKDLKRGYGFGIRFKIPGFPIRLDWGFGLDRKPKEAKWYFTLGDIF
ncbi:MAG: BamA/TamA family outer membrane protein, partial [Elusimicrobia bacterium]|nr:BamA/TamA family outer membrane protein [Elusimicrobiota bacterium]